MGSTIQAHGRAVGLYENPEALTLFMLTGPDSSRCVEEFESLLVTPNLNNVHHEEAHSLQVKYRKDVLAFVEIVQQLGNPFAPGQELVALDTHEVIEQEVVNPSLGLLTFMHNMFHRHSTRLLTFMHNMFHRHSTRLLTFMHNMFHRHSTRYLYQCQTLSDVTKY